VNGDDLPLWVGVEAGYFSQRGLDLDVQLASNTSASMAALLGGSTQFYQGGGSDAVSAAAAGAEPLIVSVSSPVYSYVLEAAPSMKTPADLKGQKIGISSVGSSADIGVRVAIRTAGLDPDTDVSIVAVGGVPERSAALANGSVQASVLNPPETLTLERQGFHPLLNLAALKLPTALQASVVTRSFAAANKPVVQAYVDGLVQSIARIKADKPFAVSVLKKYFKSEDDQAMNATYDFYAVEVIASDPTPRPEGLTDAIAILSLKNEKIRGVDPNSVIDPSYVQSALQRGVNVLKP
jgi:NitT/TauT family transport system substrate-binding protein